MVTAKLGTEGTMSKLVSIMPDVAHRALSNSMTSVGHPESKDHWVRYNFMCLQNTSTGKRTSIVKNQPLERNKVWPLK